MVRVFKFFLIFLILTVIFHPSIANAHILAKDGSIGAVLHSDPDDDPIAGSQASFFFEFKDAQNKFTPQNCYCRVDIYEGGKVIYSDAIFQDTSNLSLKNGSFFYTFPQKDVYQIKVSGRPRDGNGFQSFTLNYDIRVDRQSQNTSQPNPNFFSTYLVYFIIALALVLFLVILFIKHNWFVKNELTVKNPTDKQENDTATY